MVSGEGARLKETGRKPGLGRGSEALRSAGTWPVWLCCPLPARSVGLYRGRVTHASSQVWLVPLVSSALSSPPGWLWGRQGPSEASAPREEGRDGREAEEKLMPLLAAHP